MGFPDGRNGLISHYFLNHLIPITPPGKNLEDGTAPNPPATLEIDYYTRPHLEPKEACYDPSIRNLFMDSTGHFTSAVLYDSPTGSTEWLNLSGDPNHYIPGATRIPLENLTKFFSPSLSHYSLVGLGCAESKKEIEFITDIGRYPDKFYLFDTSGPLIDIGKSDAQKKGIRGAEVNLGSFFDSKAYPNLSNYSSAVIYTLLGYTIGNLNDPQTFLNALNSNAKKGDFLILDFAVAAAEYPFEFFDSKESVRYALQNPYIKEIIQTEARLNSTSADKMKEGEKKWIFPALRAHLPPDWQAIPLEYDYGLEGFQLPGDKTTLAGYVMYGRVYRKDCPSLDEDLFRVSLRRLQPNALKEFLERNGWKMVTLPAVESPGWKSVKNKDGSSYWLSTSRFAVFVLQKI